MTPILVECNPQDAILGGGDDSFRTIGLKWWAGVLDEATTYGEDSRVAQQVAQSDIAVAQRAEIIKNWAQGRTSGGLEANSIGKKSSKGRFAQFMDDQRAIATGGNGTAPAVLGSYTASYKILRANSTGVQAQITIKNAMTRSSFAHIATGYDTKADHYTGLFDGSGNPGSWNGSSMKSHEMTIVFRVVIPN